MTAAIFVVALLAIALSDIRWLRVAQREHYLPGAVSPFMRRWWTSTPLGTAMLVVAIGGLAFGGASKPLALAAAGALVLGPPGLGLRGRTKPLAWTRRLRTLLACTVVVQLVLIASTLVTVRPEKSVLLVALFVPATIDLALWLIQPIERRLAAKFVDQAKRRLASVGPTVVAITGSYGKTSTKVAVAHLVSGSRTVLATPASFNNRAGLSRAVNEHLAPGTDVFVAEMGTYSKGEIEELCEISPPDIAVITAIGPVHLERFRSEEAIVRAKAEILGRASVAVLNVDDGRLAQLADEAETAGKRVWRVGSTSTAASVRVVPDRDSVLVTHEEVEIVRLAKPSIAPTNIACAVAVALALDVPVEQIAVRLGNLPPVPHRQQTAVTDAGVTVIDDTYNANPAGARLALEQLRRSASDTHKRVVVTPGMIELRGTQAVENGVLAAAAAAVATDLIIVGKTNRTALRAGSRGTALRVTEVATLPQAVAWVREHVGAGDAVLYLNDLPDHYP